MKILICFLLIWTLAGCEYAAIIGNNAHRLFTIAADDRSTSDDIQDLQINTAIRTKLTAENLALMVDVEITVFEGEVLLTGTVPNGEVLNQILSVAWSVDGVKKVYNYVRTDITPEVRHIAADATFATNIKSKLALTTGIQSANYKLIVENGTVYLMGICASSDEYQKVQSILKDTSGVNKIIFLMHFASDRNS